MKQKFFVQVLQGGWLAICYCPSKRGVLLICTLCCMSSGLKGNHSSMESCAIRNRLLCLLKKYVSSGINKYLDFEEFNEFGKRDVSGIKRVVGLLL